MKKSETYKVPRKISIPKNIHLIIFLFNPCFKMRIVSSTKIIKIPSGLTTKDNPPMKKEKI
jgi:hypothetical protein